MRFLVLFVLSTSLLSAAQPTAQKPTFYDDDVLRYAKSVDVSKLDTGLPSQPLESWLRSGPARIDETVWTISRDCDLKEPSKNALGDYPLCVRLGFRRGTSGGLAMLKVGTLEHGIEGSPRFEYIEVGATFLDKKRQKPIKLSELPDVLDDIPLFGTICVLPNSAERPTRISPGGDYNPSTLMLRIDKQESVMWPHEKVIRLETLNLYERHLIVLTSDGKQIQSFKFDFADYKDSRLCVSYDGYQGVQLASRKDARWCSCK